MILWPLDPLTGDYLPDGIPILWRMDLSKPLRMWFERFDICFRER